MTIITMILLITISLLSSSLISKPLLIEPLILLPLKLQQQQHNKLSFKHNVTLTVALTVGSPPQSVTMVLDTGSELSWLRCRRSNNAAAGFYPAASATYAAVPCSGAACGAHMAIPATCGPPAGVCHVTLSYADATSVEGDLAEDTFRVGSWSRAGTVFGCVGPAEYSARPEEDAAAAGLAGLNRGPLSLASQMALRRFSYCVPAGVSAAGALLLGGAAPPPWLPRLRYTPLVKPPSARLPYFDEAAYSVRLEGVTVAGELVPVPAATFLPDHTGAGQTMVDSGTQFTFLIGEAYVAVRAAVARHVKRARPIEGYVFGGAMDLCYVAATMAAAEWPEVGLVVAGAGEIRVSGERLMWRATDGVECMTIGNSDMLGIEASVIGHYHQQDLWMEFDLVNERLGFAEVSCGQASQRLGLS